MNGSRQYLAAFAAYSDEELEEQIKQAEKAENTVISTALSSWKSVKEDLGSLQVDEMGAPLIQADEKNWKAGCYSTGGRRGYLSGRTDCRL